ncbi:hypothetical protein EMPG_14400 [Blastomyces silverae]|uniref:Uncharacterized protein n=1 Tax=Blastomyces silverae TaxID=2060906 RepID=A0A0H1BFF6_9EURO|nr:hypothetical protein EMPG_14400 [Blastomyces silverae]
MKVAVDSELLPAFALKQATVTRAKGGEFFVKTFKFSIDVETDIEIMPGSVSCMFRYTSKFRWRRVTTGLDHSFKASTSNIEKIEFQ